MLMARGSVLWLVFVPLARDATVEAVRRVVAELRARVSDPAERADLYAARARVQDPEEVEDRALALEGEALAAWLLDPNAT
jgi:hypothetical protein